MSQREGQNIFIKTFGGFDVFVDGKQVHFSSEKAKEMLAVLVDKRGSSVSLSQMAWLLYEQSPEQTAKNNLRVIYYRLKKILENNGIGGMLIKKRGRIRICGRESRLCPLVSGKLYVRLRVGAGGSALFKQPLLPVL